MLSGLFKRSNTGIPRSDARRLVGVVNKNAVAAENLERNVRAYVNGYMSARNSNNKNGIPPLNAKVVNALKRFINNKSNKRPRVAGAAAAAAGNAGGNNKAALGAASAVLAAPVATPSALGQAAANGASNNGANSTQASAAAAAAARAQANLQGQSSSAANNAGARAAGKAAGILTSTPNRAANAAGNGTAAAGLGPTGQNSAINTAVSRVNANETGLPAPLQMNINVPGSNTKVKVVRNNVGSKWRFANKANNNRYNLNNKNGNVPKVRNIGGFAQEN